MMALMAVMMIMVMMMMAIVKMSMMIMGIVLMAMVMMAMVRMQLWLNDPGNMDKLLAIKNGQQQVKLTFMMIMMTIKR